MSPIEIAVTFVEEIEKRRWFEVEQHLHEDFELYMGLPEPIDRETFLSWIEALVEACPDWSFSLKESKQVEGSVILLVGISATHTKVLELPVEGIKPLEATHQRLEVLQDEVEFNFKGNLIHRIHAHTNLHTGILGLLEQLGYEL